MRRRHGDSRLRRFLLWLLWKVMGAFYELGVWIFGSRK
jgi:hypothetical protein